MDQQDIIVTARKRDESVQQIPIAIDVVSNKALATTGTASLLQLEAIAPGLNLAKAPVGAEIGVTVRGLGSAPGAPSFDSSVSLFVDGIYAPRSREFASSVFDVERIEVIKGTQAALLGKNTSLGAINVITRKPGDELAADLRGSYQFEFGSTLLAGGIDVPLADGLAVRVSGQRLDDNGWVRDTVAGHKAPRNRDDAIRAVLTWEALSGVDVTLVAQHNISKQRGNSVEFATLSPVAEQLAALAGAPGSLDDRLDYVNATSLFGPGTEQHERLKVDRLSGTVNFDLGGGTLTSVTGYSRYTDDNLSDTDFLPGEWATRGVDESSKQFSQELRYVSPTGGTVDYVVGGLYLHNELDSTSTFFANYPFGPAPGVNIAGSFRNDFFQKTETFSAFGQMTVHATDALRLIGGLRYTHEKKTVDLGREVLVPGLYSVVIFPPYAPFRMSRSDGPVDYSAGVQYDISPDITTYVSYGKGTKSGGFASSATFLDQSEYDSETARTLEGGIKAQDAGRRWLLNLSVFDTKVSNFQTVTFNGVTFNIFNTDLRSTGVELQANWRPVEPLRVYLNNTYADARDRNTDGHIPLAPKWSGSGGFSLNVPVTGAIDFLMDGSIDYRSSRTYQQDPAAAEIGNPFTTFNLSIAAADSNEHWEVRLIGRNLTDKKGIAFAFPTPIIGTQSVMSERSRTIALQVSVKM
ncbi:TonB-dependent receptor [Sphingomonas sp. LaA6.9]|uniref:TonB-dependent receptor n=1 Tax=Sphingomonas sp. LaA6.9 TaxID=2919914 RepID=UPI001F4FA702|nr:TonB-dependent receptor [Sphingomonas sp. LaA6.9]MCJ8158294.1 TonB-dependent receptor [Sphingomonas sp. LaA6.9]